MTFQKPVKQTPEYDSPSGGWGSVRGMIETLAREQTRPGAIDTLLHQNKPGGTMCVSCSWAKPADPHPVEFCENGAKATLWELTSRRCTPEFFARHTLTELLGWSDYELEQQGRLTEPLRYDPATDRYVRCTWDEAFAAIGGRLKQLDPKSVVFYASGRASLETSYLYGLLARAYGCNNLPDSSNMCHETTSVALKKTLGVGVGTVVFDDLAKTDAMFFFGQNTGSNSPRFLHPLRDAARRGVPIVTFNPVRERGLEVFRDPQSVIEMVSGGETKISTQYHQVRPGGDIAVLVGMCKRVLEADDEARAAGGRVVDWDFIAEHTNGFEAFAAAMRSAEWAEIEATSGLDRAAVVAAADVYIRSTRATVFFGMGLTQHVHGFDNVAMVVNLLLLKGQIGLEGAGISPVRGHSNVQGQRTVGIAEKPELVPLDRLAEQYGFEPPRDEGLNTVAACEGVLAGRVSAFIGLGGNFVRAIPERDAMEAAWAKLKLTVQVATKLNRSHLVHGEAAYLLPCLGRTEEDRQASGPQTVSMEDTFSSIHASRGKRTPASRQLLSELAIVSRLAEATLPPKATMPWQEWTGDYRKIRAAITATYPDLFKDYEKRMWQPGGFYKGNKARERVWETKSGKAEFTVPSSLDATGLAQSPGRFRLITMRSNDQFNTTVYGLSDRLRGIEGARDVLLMNAVEMGRAGLRAGQRVRIESDAEDGVERRSAALRVTPFNLPDGCLGAYYPEANNLVPLDHHDGHSGTPASKSVPVRIVAAAAA